jgi:uncharacterized protein (DUF924 family)
MIPEPDKVLDFWFSDEMKNAWFRSTPTLDGTIRERFETLWRSAADGAIDGWTTTPQGALALVIVLDQFPLNMFRHQPAAFSTEGRAIDVCKAAIGQCFDLELPGDQRAFLYMPLMHSEQLTDQDLSVRLFEKAGLEANLRFARHHREIIRRFGRFPHRNAILGRANTPGERDYLASKEAFLG